MDVNDGRISSEDSDISLETQPPAQVSDRGSGSPPPMPARFADIPPNSASRPPDRERPYFDGASLELAQQAIQHWRLPRHPEYGTLARRTRSFYREVARWDAEGKPSVRSLAAAGFYSDGRFTII